MENEVQQNISSAQSPSQTSPVVPTSTNKSNVLLFTVLGLIVIAGSVFVGIQIGKTQTPSQQLIVAQPTILPTQAITSLTVIPTQIVTPTVDPTANWKMYTNKELSFKYPSDWEEQKTQVFGSKSETEFRFDNTTTFTFSLIGNYNQITGAPYTSLEEYLDVRSKFSSNTTVAGQIAKKIINSGGGLAIAYKEVVFFTPKKDNIVSMYFSGPYYTEDDNKAENIFNQILSTSKFTN